MPVIVVILSSHFSLLSPCKAELSSNPSWSQRSICLCRPRPEASPESSVLDLLFFDLMFITFDFWIDLQVISSFPKYYLCHSLTPLRTCTILPPTFQFSFLDSFFYFRWPCLIHLLLDMTPHDQRPYHCNFVGPQTLKAMIRIPGIL